MINSELSLKIEIMKNFIILLVPYLIALIAAIMGVWLCNAVVDFVVLRRMRALERRLAVLRELNEAIQAATLSTREYRLFDADQAASISSRQGAISQQQTLTQGSSEMPVAGPRTTDLAANRINLNIRIREDGFMIMTDGSTTQSPATNSSLSHSATEINREVEKTAEPPGVEEPTERKLEL